MADSGWIPDVVIYAMVIDGLSKDDKVDKAVEVFDEMVREVALQTKMHIIH